MYSKKGFEDFFENTGVQKIWFARKIGMSRPMIYAILAGGVPIPRKYWQKIIEYTKGFVKAEHLIADHLEYHFKNFPLVKIEKFEEGKWLISAKTPSQNT